jgi:hypothetical protein
VATDAEQRAALTRYLVRTQDVDSIKAFADQAFAAYSSGAQVTSISFEGGGGTMHPFDPSTLLNACEDALSQLGEPGAVAGGSISIFTRFYGETLQT